MVKRKKRLLKGIKSIEEQIIFHQEKKKIAEKLRQEELARYYGKEIESLERRRDDRQEKANKS